MAEPNGNTVQAVDSEGEVLMEGTEGGEESLLEQVVAEADARARRIRPLTMGEIKAIRENDANEPIEIGIMGWFAKVGEAKAKGGKVNPGSQIVGQIVSAITTKGGQFGPQQAVIIFGKYSCPAHLNRQSKKIPEVKEKAGRWLVGIDSTLTELMTCIGEVVSIEMQTAAQPGSGQRHQYKHVTLYQR